MDNTDKITIDHSLLYQFRMMILEEGLCPNCLGRTNRDLQCTKPNCQYDAWEEWESSDEFD